MKVSRLLALSFVLLMILLGVSSAYSAPFSFIAMADSRGSTNGVNDAVLSDIVDLILQEDAAVVLFPGDLVNGSCTDSILTSQLNHWRDVMAPIYNSNMYGAKVYAGPGNHDICYSGSELVWQSIFSDLPSDGPAGETNMTYSFDYMNAHFIMLNTDRAGNIHTINYDWLANDLASTTMEHIFVFGHDPAFPAGPHLGSSLDYYLNQRDAFWQLLVDYDVDIYFAGHEHLYNHINVDGVDQIIAGTSGAPIHHGYGGEFYHYAVVTVAGPNVFVEIIDDSGAVRDSFENNAPVFEDVPPGHWAEEAIYRIYDAGITTGCSQAPLMYCPENTVNRTQMAVFLGRGVHSSSFIPPEATGIFTDVVLNHWAADWIEQIYDDGITTGCNASPLMYCPSKNVTRAQMAVFLLRAKYGGSYTPPPATGIFTDVSLSHWAAAWIEQLYTEGITVGCSTNPLQYCPGNTVTRAQMAVFLMRTFEL